MAPEPRISRTKSRYSTNSVSTLIKSGGKLSQSSIHSKSNLWSMKIQTYLVRFCTLFGFFQLLAGKVQFGVILGWIVVFSIFLYIVFNMLVRWTGNLELHRCTSVVGYSMLPMVMFSAISLILPRGGIVDFGVAAVFVIWATRVCARLLVCVMMMSLIGGDFWFTC